MLHNVCTIGLYKRGINMISLKDYAAQKNVTYEAIRRQVSRYKEELEGHIVMDGRQQFLDDEAVAFLDERRQKNPVILYQQSKDDEIAALKEEREKLSLKLAAMGEKVAELTQFKLETIEKRQLLEASKEAQEQRERELDQREANMTQEVKMAAQEATEAARRASDEYWVQEVEKVRKEAQKATQAAVKAKEDELHLQHQKELQEEQSRAISLKEWWSRRKKGKKNENNEQAE